MPSSGSPHTHRAPTLQCAAWRSAGSCLLRQGCGACRAVGASRTQAAAVLGLRIPPGGGYLFFLIRPSTRK